MRKAQFIIGMIFLFIYSSGLKAQVNTDYDTCRGFIHPGGIHTQADFDRVKKQIASGNSVVTEAFNVLKNSAYSQSNVTTYPVDVIVRGGSGDNYMNAARGAAMAYQNALMWKITGEEVHAYAAVRVLMAWASKTRAISGNSNYALAAGLYGYQFAQAAELMRDYEGWKAGDFLKFKRWMLDVWYPCEIRFLRSRNGTWENSGKWWKCPGHYWSNWGLCNDLALMSIGVLCDDVFIYNQGLSYFKYDQVGTFKNSRTAVPVLNDGLSEFLGNFVVTTAESSLEKGAYGKLGQLQESGRDIGHATMSLGLALDIAHIGWNQGDDIFSYMDNRMAAGIEYLAAETQSVPNLPWINYKYASNTIYWTDSRSWLQTGPALGSQIRPYWGTVIGHYEGVMGIKMPFSEKAYHQMGIDGGGTGNTSGGYDHLGFSVLMNTYDGLAEPDCVPVLLSPKMVYDGDTIKHNELGGLKNTYQVDVSTTVPRGEKVKLMPQLPSGETDTGIWKWNTGETTKDIVVSTDKSYVYRVTYKNGKGIKSELAFSIAVAGDCNRVNTTQKICQGNTVIGSDSASVFYGDDIVLQVDGTDGYGAVDWGNGISSKSLSLLNLKKDSVYLAYYVSQGEMRIPVSFSVHVKYIRPDVKVSNSLLVDTSFIIVKKGQSVELVPYVPSSISQAVWKWNTGDETKNLLLNNIDKSGRYVLYYTLAGISDSLIYNVMVRSSSEEDHIIPGTYLIHHINNDTYMTETKLYRHVFFDKLLSDGSSPSLKQVWNIKQGDGEIYDLQSMADSLYVSLSYISRENSAGFPFCFENAIGSKFYAIHDSHFEYIFVDSGGVLHQIDDLTGFPYELIPVSVEKTGIKDINEEDKMRKTEYYTVDGVPLSSPGSGLFIEKKNMKDGTVIIQKKIIR